VVFNLIGALSEHGKLGMVAIAADPEGADALYEQTIAVLLREAGDRPDLGKASTKGHSVR
jgi:hypothetical protein